MNLGFHRRRVAMLSRPSNQVPTAVFLFAMLISVLLLAAVYFLGSREMNRLHAENEGVAQNEWVDVQLATEAMEISSENRSLDLEIHSAHNEAEMEALVAERAGNSGKISAIIQRLETRVGSQAEQRLLDAVIRDRNDYLACREILDNLPAKPNPQTTAESTKKMLVLFGRYHAAWRDFVRFQFEEMNTVLTGSAVSNANVRRRTLLLVLLAIATELLLLALISRKVLAEMQRRSAAEDELRHLNEHLESLVRERTAALDQSNGQLLAEVSERKNAEVNLKWKTALLEAQLNSTLDGILVIDTEGHVKLRNKRFAQLLKIPQSLVERRDDDAMLQHAASDIKDSEQFLQRVRYA